MADTLVTIELPVKGGLQNFCNTHQLMIVTTIYARTFIVFQHFQ